jgi:hypothetical protein
MTKPKGFEYDLVERNLTNRWSITRGKKIISKTLTIPKRIVDTWEADKTLVQNGVVVVPLGEPNSRLGVLVLPAYSPLLLRKDRLGDEVSYFTKRLNEQYNSTLHEMYSQLLAYDNDSSIMKKVDAENMESYLDFMGFNEKHKHSKGYMPGRMSNVPLMKVAKRSTRKKPSKPPKP